MISNIDIAIFIGFLVVTIIFGLSSSYGITNIKEYAIGDKKFSTAAIAATLVATWASGQAFFAILSESYKDGLYKIWTELGYAVSLLLTGLVFAPRMGEFMNNLSIAEAMGDIYGKRVRIITAIAGFIASAGMIAMQLKVSGSLLRYCFNWPEMYGILISGIIITIYSSLGGIKSVTFTDVIQFATFTIMIPTLTFFILSTIEDPDVFLKTVTTHELFDYKQVFDFTRSRSLYFLFFFLFLAIPGFGPATFQRISMAKNINQVQKSFCIAAVTCYLIGLIICFLGVLIFSTNSNLTYDEIIHHTLFKYSYPGLIGCILAGITAMVMSTADSYVNSSSVLFVHDFCKPIGIRITNELFVTRIASFFLGMISIFIALVIYDSLRGLVLFANMFYMPIVTVPFILAVFGFRSTSKSVLIGMAAGAITVIIWEKFLNLKHIPGLVPGMGANLIFLFASHYILRQKGGWIGIKDPAPLIAIKRERSMKFKQFIESIKNFNFSKFIAKNSPNDELMYIYTGLFCFLSLYSNMSTIPKTTRLLFPELFQFITPSVLFSATALLSYPLWLESWKKKEIVAHLIWNAVALYGLIFIGVLFPIISNFATFQVMMLIINLIMIGILVRWQWALVMFFSGTIVAITFVNNYLPGALNLGIMSLKLKLMYTLLVIGSLLMVFIRPKQERQSLIEEKVLHLSSRLLAQEKEVLNALSLKSEFIRNMQHEYHTPMTGIMAMSQMLHDSFDNLSDKDKKEAAEVIYKSFVRLESFDSNLASLAKLTNANFELKTENVEFSHLLQDRVKICRKLYEESESQREFILNLPSEEVIIQGDKYYLQQMLDNLIINAITYCEHGLIEITLEKLGPRFLRFYVRDSGIGIPPSELLEVFGEFMVSSKTRTPSGGRGMGLALCKKVVAAHQGSILAESDGESWTLFTVTLPLR
ncbi:Putative Na+/proline symporter [Candidatus Phycorickettsia trachydisci]|uniref:histidine kinase n=1 Tax=Candidatus Phycorickettsia trachydisci TaxID=2115978 RepID=A0A2P1PA48_9RICK|nr:ATP-binding protein [Candidatus Phycorickettsia trachydisci]AVP88138.1 Putative Na+/proline symporter [Candidatus Phycorickettsia trachydisci]